MNITELIKECLTTHYETVEWDKSTGLFVLDGKEALSNDLKQLKARIVADALSKYNISIQPGDITKPLLKKVVLGMMVVEPLPEEDKDVDEPKRPKPEDWMVGMDLTEKGQVVDNAMNDVILFEQHPVFKGRLYYNEIEQSEQLDGKDINDIQLAVLKTDIERLLGGNRNVINVKTAVLAFCDSHRYNPLKENLLKLKGKWDGKKRIETLFVKAHECPDDEYHRYVSKVLFYAWVNRILNPGCKFDVLFVFVGDHGIGKSEFLPRLLRSIGGKVSEGVTFSSDRDNLEKIADSQLCMMSEMKSMKKSDLEAIKELLGRSMDTFARKYRSNNNFKRSCILVGNVNLEYKHILKDSAEYERRFILFDCKAEGSSKGVHNVRSDKEWWDENFDDYEMEQIWAEAMDMVENEPKFQWVSLPQNIMTKLKGIQQECKAIRVDDIFLQKLDEVLNLPFVEEGYDNYDRFVAAIENAKLAVVTPKSGRLNWIRKPILRRYIKDVLREDRSSDYFDQAMSMMGWHLEMTKYSGEKKTSVNSNRYIRNSNDTQTVMDL